jgi:hypothetical protein
LMQFSVTTKGMAWRDGSEAGKCTSARAEAETK